MQHDEIQKRYPNHFFTARRGKGSVRKLAGKIDVLVFFVNDSQSRWTELAKQRYRKTQKAAMQTLVRMARSKGVQLQMRNAYIDATSSMECYPANYNTWSKEIVAKYGRPAVAAFQDNYEVSNRCDEAPIIFVLNKSFRSGAISLDRDCSVQGEMSIISSDFTEHAIIHELLHQFGAMDLYYPRELKNLVERMNYESVMATAGCMHFDSLTCYLIGWTDEIDFPTVQILERTKHYTREYMTAVIKSEYAGR